MKKIKLFNSIMLMLIIISDVSYMILGGLNLKGMTSLLFLVTGLINLVSVGKEKGNLHFKIFLFIGLIFAFFGDILLEIYFVVGAALFALGHIFFFIAYIKLHGFCFKDLMYCCVIFIPSVFVILYVPIFDFGGALMQSVCLVYALIISLMVGKALSNFITKRNKLNLIILLGSVLFFISDFMLLFNVFSNLSMVFGILCLSTYYPAEFLLAYSILESDN